MKTAQELYASMLAVFREKTGYDASDGCDLSVRLYALAAGLESLYAYADFMAQQAFPQTAVGEHLDLHGTMRGLTRKPGSRAAGRLRLSVGEAHAVDLTIPAGSVFSTAAGVQYATDCDAVIAAGSSSVEAPATCTVVGTVGNAPPEGVCVLTQAPYAVVAVRNAAAMTGGMDAEDDETFRARILLSYSRLPNGANAAYYESVALSDPAVAACRVVPRYAGIGTVGVYVATEEGMPDEVLIQRLQANMQALREIAVQVQVLQPLQAAVDIQAQVWPAPGYSAEQAIQAAQQALRGYFTGRLLGGPVYRSTLGHLLYDTGMISNYQIVRPAQDMAARDTVLPVLGTLQVTQGA